MNFKLFYATCGSLIAGLIMGVLIVAGSPKLHYLNNKQYSNYKTLEYKESLIRAYENYYDANELYLDEIDDWYDVETGSDVCEFYHECKSVLDSIRNK